MSDAPEIEERIKQIIRTIAGTYWIAREPSQGEGPRPQTVMEVTTNLPSELRATLLAEGKDPDATWFVYSQMDPSERRLVRALVHIPPTLLSAPENVAKGAAAHEAGHLAITRQHLVIPDDVFEIPGFAPILAATEERATDHVVQVRFPGAGAWLQETRETSVRENLAPEGAESTPRALPRHLQLCNAIIFDPYSRALAQCSPEVQAVFEQIRADVTELEQTLPGEHATEREIRAAAIERYRIAYTRIWPKVEPLVRADLQDELRRRMTEQLEGAGSQDGPPTRNGSEPMGPIDAGAGVTPDVDAALARLSDDERRSLEQEAFAAMRDMAHTMSDAAAGTLEPGVGLRLPTREAPSSLVDEPPRDDCQGSAPSLTLAETVRALGSLSERKTPWDATYAAVRGLDRELSARLEELFAPTRAGRARRRRTGARLALGAVFRWEARRAAGATDLDDRLFESRDRAEARDHAVTILVDMSGSMAGGNIQEAFTALVLLVEVLTRLDIAMEVLGFQTSLMVFKEFSESTTPAVRSRMEAIAHSADNGNADGPCLREASRRLAQQPAKVKILFVISDGLPTDGPSPVTTLHAVVAEILTSTDQILIGIGLGEGTAHVQDFYPASIANVAATELPRMLADLLEDVLSNPTQYRAPRVLLP